MNVPLQALLRCYAADLSGPEDALKRSLADADLEAAETWRRATAHGLLPSLYLIACEHTPALVPQAAKVAFASQSSKALAFARELPRIIDHLGRAGIQSLPLKGPVLANTAFGNVLARTPKDLDLLVRPGDRDRAIEALQDLGYRPNVERRPRAERRHRRRCHDYDLTDSTGAIALELHDRLRSGRWPKVDVEDLFARRVEIEFMDGIRSSLGPEDQIWYLSTHGAMHQWCRLEWLVSLAYQIVRGGKVDWTTVLDLAERAGALRATLIGLCLANLHLGVELPSNVHRAFAEDGSVRELADRAMHELQTGEARSVSNIAFNAAIRGSAMDRVRYLTLVAGNVARRQRGPGGGSSNAPWIFRTVRRGGQLATSLWASAIVSGRGEKGR